MKDIFTREKTWQIKGIAILLMLAHHLFTFSDRFYKGYKINSLFNISGVDLAVLIGDFGKICVSIFMFLGGYGLYKTFQKSNFLDKVINLYKKYWKTFLIFIPIGYLLFSNQEIYTANIDLSLKFSEFSFKTVISDFLILSNNLNGEWWFLKSYIFALFNGYLFIELMKKKNNIYLESFIVLIWYILTNGVFSYYGNLIGINNFMFNNLFIDNGYSILLLVGVVFSKYNIFNKITNAFNKYSNIEKGILSLVAIILIIYTRVFYFDVSMDILLTPLFIFFSYTLINLLNKLNIVFEFLGKNSTNMWLNHTFFCYYFGIFAKYVYSFNNPLVSFILLLVLSLGASLLTDLIWKIVYKIYFNFKKILNIK